ATGGLVGEMLAGAGARLTGEFIGEFAQVPALVGVFVALRTGFERLLDLGPGLVVDVVGVGSLVVFVDLVVLLDLVIVAARVVVVGVGTLITGDLVLSLFYLVAV